MTDSPTKTLVAAEVLAACQTAHTYIPDPDVVPAPSLVVMERPDRVLDGQDDDTAKARGKDKKEANSGAFDGFFAVQNLIRRFGAECYDVCETTELGAFLAGIEPSESVTQGSVRLPKPMPTLEVQLDELYSSDSDAQTDEKVTDKVSHEYCGPVNNLDVQLLQSLAKRAPFGRGSETVLDTKVRDAYELLGRGLMFMDGTGSGCGWNMGTWLHKEIIPNLKKALVGGFRCKLTLELYKMHIYTVGGHFDAHRDTLHHDDHFATLVIGLPIPHKGGDLCVIPADEEGEKEEPVRFQTSAIPAESVGWCAFFTDCKHYVEPVTSGTRVVLQFDVRREITDREFKTDFDGGLSGEGDDEKDAASNEHDEAMQRHLHPRVDVLLRDKDGNPTRNSVVALIVSHKYGISCSKPEHLRGRDFKIYTHLRDRYECSLKPCVIQEREGLDNGRGGRELLLKFVNPVTAKCVDVDDDITEVVPVPMSGAITTYILEQDPAIEYTGNESAPSCYVYYSFCLLVRHKPETCIEPPAKRRRIAHSCV